MSVQTEPVRVTPGEERWRLPPMLLPDGEQRDLWIDGGRLAAVPADGAEVLPGRFALPGLVDAHAHVAIGPGLQPLDAASARDALLRLREQGILLVRDVGAPRSVTLRIAPDPSLPHLIAAGRWLAPSDRFFAALHEPVAPEGLVEAALGEVSRGARWVKVITDWMTPELSYDAALLRSLVDAVHAAGARVAAHTTWPTVREVVSAGVDSVEHGCGLDAGTVALMAARGIAWTPTLTALLEPLPADASRERRDRRERLLGNDRAMLAEAVTSGVTILAGTDCAGTLTDEVRNLVAFGLTPVRALRAATTDARAFLGLPSLVDGGPADVVTFEGDPRDDPEVLAYPASVVLGGVRVR